MNGESFVEQIAVSLGIKQAQLKTADVHAKIPALKRKAEEYEREAVVLEGASLANRAKAFSPETPATERARLMRQSTADAQKAKTMAGFAATFLTQLGQFVALETTMQIADEMKEVGLLGENVTVADWQSATDTMQDEIQRMIATSQKLGDVMSGVLTQNNADAGESVADELNELFAKWEAETDPVKKAEIQKLIEAKSNAALA